MRKFLLSAFAATALLAFGGGARAQVNFPVNAQTGTTYTVVNTDCGKLITLSNASAIAVTLPQASTPAGGGGASGFFYPGCPIQFANIGAGTATITPTTSTIGGQTTLVLNTLQGAMVISDGANYQVQAGGAGPLGQAANFAANGAVATTVTSLGPTGSHTTIQEWLIVFDAAGTKRWIPMY